jgi:hypothetical protein
MLLYVACGKKEKEEKIFAMLNNSTLRQNSRKKDSFLFFLSDALIYLNYKHLCFIKIMIVQKK